MFIFGYHPLLVFRFNTKGYCIQLAKSEVDANRPKSPPPQSDGKPRVLRFRLIFSYAFGTTKVHIR